MMTAMRVAGVLSTFVVATHPATAQPPGTTDPALKQYMSKAATGGTANTAPGCNSSGPPGVAAPTPPACSGSESAERSGAFVLGGLSVAAIGPAADLRLGWMINARLGVFASTGMIVVVDGGGVGVAGVGARLWGDRLFLEARAAAASTTTGCEFDDPCVDETFFLGAAGAGVELIHRRHVGLELRGEVIFNQMFQDNAVFFATLGLGFYL